MTKMWDYAWLSKLAKSTGGPEELVKQIAAANRAAGRKEIAPYIALAALLGAGAMKAVDKVRDYLKEKQAQSSAAEEAAAVELIAGIKEYDRTHPEPDGIEKNAE